MQRKKVPGSFLLLILISILISNSILLSISPVFAAGEPFLTGWTYRKSHVIEQLLGADTGYQVAIVTRYGNGTDGDIEIYGNTIAGLIYLNGTCQTDFDDVRFTEDDGLTLLSYWPEEKFNSNNATFWIKLTDDLTAGDVTIFVYWGNAAAEDVSSGENTFLVYDGFDNNNLNSTLWTNQTQDAGTIISESSGYLTMQMTTGQAHTGGNVICTTDLDDSVSKIAMSKMMKTTGYTQSYSEYVGWTNATDQYNKAYYCLPAHYVISILYYYPAGTDWAGVFSGSGWNYVEGHVNLDPWTYWFRVNNRIVPGSVSNGTFNKTEGSYQSNTISSTPSSASPVKPQYVCLGTADYNTASYTYFDWVAVRKWTSTQEEPTHGEWGELESSIYTLLFYFNTGGTFRVDCVEMENGTEIYPSNGTVLEFAAIVEFNYTFANFSWSGGYSTSNPYNFTVSNNDTIWCYFSEISLAPSATPSPPGVDNTVFNESKNLFLNSQYISPNQTVIDDMEDVSDWSKGYAGGTVEADTVHYVEGIQSLNISSPDSSTPCAADKSGTWNFTNQHLRFMLYIDDVDNLGQFAVYLAKSAWTVYAYKSYSVSQFKTGWNIISLGFANYSASGETLQEILNETVKFRFRITAAASAQVSVCVDILVYNSDLTSGKVTLVFDDNRDSTYETVYPLLSSYGFRAVDCVAPNAQLEANSSIYMTLEQMQTLNSAQWDIISHGYNHTEFETLTDLELRTELFQSRNWLVENGFLNGSRFIAAPYYSWNYKIVQTVSDYFEMMRSTPCEYGYYETLEPATEYNLRTFPVLNTTSVSSITTAINQAQEYNQWLILTFHVINETTSESTVYSTADFEQILSYIDSESVPVITFSDFFDSYSIQLPAGEIPAEPGEFFGENGFAIAIIFAVILAAAVIIILFYYRSQAGA